MNNFFKEFLLQLTDPIEWIGILAAILVLVSMCFPARSKRSNVAMRIFNNIGSILFVLYAFIRIIPCTAILNTAVIFVNFYHMVKASKS